MNDLQLMVGTIMDLAWCRLIQKRLDNATELYIKAGWCERMLAYRDDGKRLRLLLAFAASTAGLAIFLGSKFDDLILKHAANLSTLEAWEVIVRCVSEAVNVDERPGWQGVSDGVNLARHVQQQAEEFASGRLARWQYAL